MPLTIGIGGDTSGAGKTHFARLLIRALTDKMNVGAVKVTPEPLYCAVVDDPAIIMEPGKDTALMAEAGAEVLWVRGPREAIGEALETSLKRLGGCEAVIIEGNSAIEVLRPDIVIFINNLPQKPKPGADRVLSMAHVVIGGGEGPKGARTFSREEIGGACLEYILGLAMKRRRPYGQEA